MKAWQSFIGFALMSASVGAQEQSGSYIDGQDNLPTGVSALIDRIVECSHWLGEPPYDSDRAKDIEAAVAKLRCNALPKEKATMLKKYRKNTKVQNAIHQAENITL